MGVYTKFDHLK